MEDLPPLDAVLLSHYHGDHFDQDVEARLSRKLPIITTPHAKDHLSNKGEESFIEVTALDTWDTALLPIQDSPAKAILEGRQPAFKVTGMPGEHVPPGPLETINDIVKAIPPTNGWMLELGSLPIASISTDPGQTDFECGYRIYISRRKGKSFREIRPLTLSFVICVLLLWGITVFTAFFN